MILMKLDPPKCKSGPGGTAGGRRVAEQLNNKCPRMDMVSTFREDGESRIQQPTTTPSVHDLPVEMVDFILRNLGHDAKLEARLVCKQWKELIDKNVNFRPVLCSDTWKHVAQCSVVNLVELIVVNLPASRRIPLTMAKVKNLTLGAGIPFVNISRFLKLNPENITCLTLDHLALSARAFRGEFLAKLNMACLSELKLVSLADSRDISFYPTQMKYINHVHGLISVLTHLQAPQLKTLKGEFYASHRPILNNTTEILLIDLMRYLFVTFVQFAATHHESLTSLSLEFTSPKSPHHPDPSFPDLSKLRLESLELKPDVNYLADMVKIVKTVPGLKTLRMERSFIYFPSDGEEFEEVIKAQSKTLETLDIGLVVFKSTWITACHNLKSLTLEMISHTREVCELTTSLLPAVEHLHLRYAFDNEGSPKNDLFFWLRNSFPNLKTVVLEFTHSYISTHFIKLLLGLMKLYSIIVMQPRPPPSDDIDWNFDAFCVAVPGVTMEMMDLSDGRSVFYDFKIKRNETLNTLYQNLLNS